jgi:hypothetical protein
MAFIRKRGKYRQLIETYREDGKVKQRVLANLGAGDTIEAAIPLAERWLRIAEFKVANIKEHIAIAEKVVERRYEEIAKVEASGRRWYYERKPENEGVPHWWPRYRDPDEQTRSEAAFDESIPELRQQFRRLEQAWGFREDDEWIAESVEGERHSQLRVNITHTLHELRKMLPPAEGTLAMACKDLADLRRAATDNGESSGKGGAR